MLKVGEKNSVIISGAIITSRDMTAVLVFRAEAMIDLIQWPENVFALLFPMFIKSGQPLPRSCGCHGLTLNSHHFIAYSLHQDTRTFPSRAQDTRHARLETLVRTGPDRMWPVHSFLKFCGWRCCVMNGVISVQEHFGYFFFPA